LVDRVITEESPVWPSTGNVKSDVRCSLERGWASRLG